MAATACNLLQGPIPRLRHSPRPQNVTHRQAPSPRQEAGPFCVPAPRRSLLRTAASQWWGSRVHTRAMPAPRRAIIMVRLSSFDFGGDSSTSPERQEEQCRAYCAARGWEAVHVIRDLDVSASDKGLRLDRPGLIEARSWYPRVDVLVVAKLDRLARNVADFLAIHEEARAQAVDVVSVNEGLDMTTPAGRFVAIILAAFAEMEAATISQRVLDAVAFLAREGRHRGGNAPFGWRITPRPNGLEGFYLTLDPDTAPYLRYAVERLIAGDTPDAICEEFNALDYPAPGDNYRPRQGRPRRAPRWSADWLRLAVRQPILRGMQKHRGALVRDPNGLPIRPHEPLMTDAEWRALQDAMSPRSRPRRRAAGGTRDNVELFGRVACATCGAVMHAVERTYPIWSCSRRHLLSDGSRCPGTTIQRDQLAAYVEREALREAGHLPGWRITEEERPDDDLHSVSEALDATLSALRDVDDPDEEGRLLARRRALRARLREIQDAPAIVEAEAVPTGSTFAADYAAASPDTRAALIRSQVGVILISKGTKGRHGLDASRVLIVWQPSPVEETPDAPADIYREDKPELL